MMDPKIEKVLRLWRSTQFEGEKVSAQARVEAMLAGSGMTFTDALAELEAMDAPQPDIAELVNAAMKAAMERAERSRSRNKKRVEQFHRESEARLAAIVARYGSLEAARAPTPAEKAILTALARFIVVDHSTGRTIWMNGLESDGSLDLFMADEIMQAVRGAVPWPKTYAEAVAERQMWADRAYDLRCVQDDLVTGDFDKAVKIRVDAIGDLADYEFPTKTATDTLDRLQRYHLYTWYTSKRRKKMIDAVERDLAAMAHAEPQTFATVHAAEPTLDDMLKADPSRSDRDIARQVGCSPTTVGKARMRLGLDAIERSVQRGGQIYKMKRPRAVVE